MQKDFILGVGCQKGGTTWLWNQLNCHETFDFGFKKEYHVFDILYGSGEKPKSKVNFREFLRKYILYKPNKTKPYSYKRDYFLLDQKHYFDYFNSLFLNNNKLTTTGDITPAYAGLPKEAFKQIKENLEEKNFKVKVIFLMRDPIERIFSQGRMLIRNYKNGTIKVPAYKSKIDSLENKSSNAFFEYLYQEPRCILRTRYENTINNLENIFDPEDIFYCLYEQLFTDESLDRLKSFLGIYNLNFNKDKIIHQSPKLPDQNLLLEELKKRIFYFYQNTYSFCDKKFNSSLFWNNYF